MVKYQRVALRSCLIAICCVLVVSVALLSSPANATNPHRTVYYRINGTLEHVEGDGRSVTGSWRFHAKTNSAGGWDGEKPIFDWPDRSYSFDANFILAEPGAEKTGYALRNLEWVSWGGWASWVGRGHGKQDAPWYQFGTTGFMDLYRNGRLLSPKVWVEVVLTRDYGDSHGRITIDVYSNPGEEHMMTLSGMVQRFQAIDFMVPE
ncbi:MAG: hypothetical protein M1571_02615 [Firmicutes bacterium]|nr:hypothetical protein [Bacillota bacterium]